MKLRFPTFAGKALGALLGYVIGNWVGMALGIILGHSFDYHRTSLISQLKRLPRGRLPRPNERFYRDTLFVSLGHLAKQDGRVSPQEIAAAEALFKRLKLKQKERQEAIDLFNQGKLTASEEVDQKLYEVGKCYASRKAKRLEFIDQLLIMAYAEGGPREAQLQRLQGLLQPLDISPTDFNRLHRRLRQNKGYQQEQQQKKQQRDKNEEQGKLVSAYRTLGLNSSASNEEIKLTYRRLMSQNHPDKLMAQGLTERALGQAKYRAQEIQQAYALLKKARGI
ncbi:co-chaperone DjlA [Marinospirillum perlucidum]|uniref:co-chaperone DjlA n=1 Tax=Marinospirillum perlucidum TaxID=1982602 RepID=UPI000DF2F04A|nr:co-chaperone DjlA [Marinospirillum perlucidum]